MSSPRKQFIHLKAKLLGVLLATGLIVANGISTSDAAVLYATDFDGTDGSQPTDWAMTVSGTTVLRILNNEYRADSGIGFAISIYDGLDNEGQPATNWTDYTITSVFRQSGTANGGLVARVQSGGTSFYTARINGTGAGSVFELYRVGGPGTLLLDSQTGINYTAGQAWTIELSVIGSEISARLINNSLVEVASLSATDASFSMGTAGVRGNPFNNVIVWENFEVASVPEPGTASLVLGMGALSLAMRQRR